MKQILGIDVGGTKIAIGLVDSQLKVTRFAQIPTSQSNPWEQLLGLIEGYDGFDGIAIGFPGQVLSSGMVVKLGNIPAFKSMNVKNILEKKFRMPVSVLNDSKAFALAEAIVGQGRNKQSVVGIILGTGIGMGWVNNSKLYFGKDGLAGEFEHMTLLDGKMIRDYRKLVKSFDNLSTAKKFVRSIISLAVLSFNPDLIVLGGGWSKLSGMEKMANELAKNVGGYKNITPVKVSKLKYAGIVGAALTLLKK
jgi:predicted NBD/HSP70 family sugar kinase